MNEFQLWSFLGDLWAKYQGYILTFWPKMADFDHFSICNQLNEFQFWSFLGDFWAKYQGYSLTFWPKMAEFDHFSICNQNE